jgi:hypothetical protein
MPAITLKKSYAIPSSLIAQQAKAGSVRNDSASLLTRLKLDQNKLGQSDEFVVTV